MLVRQNWFNRIAQVKANNHIPIIAEIKPSSPAAGQLLCERTLEDIVYAYTAGGAACISVVTGRWFGGELAMLSQIAQLTDLPLLRKDLIVNADQIKKSIDHGANAVLLTKKILQPSHLLKLLDLCLSLNVTPFVEVSTKAEVDELPINGQMIIGIANRDIAQKEMDIDSGLNSLSLIVHARSKAGVIISASGIQTPEEANALYNAGFDGLLVGTSLLQADNPQLAVNTLSTRINTEVLL